MTLGREDCCYGKTVLQIGGSVEPSPRKMRAYSAAESRSSTNSSRSTKIKELLRQVTRSDDGLAFHRKQLDLKKSKRLRDPLLESLWKVISVNLPN